MHMEEPLYRQPAGASVCVIIENIGREKTLREKYCKHSKIFQRRTKLQMKLKSTLINNMDHHGM